MLKRNGNAPKKDTCKWQRNNAPLVNGVRGAMEQATDLRNHMSFEDKHSFVFYSLRYLPFLK